MAAARACGIDEIVVVGGPAVQNHCDGRVTRVIAAVPDGRANLRAALVAAEDRPLLLLTSDLPFVDAKAVGAFLDGIDDAEIVMPLATPAAYEARFPGAPPHFTTIGRERVAGASVFYFAAGVAPRALVIAEQVFAARKNLFGLAVLLGPELLARFLIRRLAIVDVERRAQRRLGVHARAVRGSAPELCFDIDTLEDYRYAQTVVATR